MLKFINVVVLVVITIVFPLGTTQLYSQNTTISTSPTERYFQTHSLDTIKNYLGGWQWDYTEQSPFMKYQPFLNQIIEKEKEEGFFGYHGCSQQYRIFQDILRAVFEEVFEYDIPEDFQFLRIPGDTAFDLKKGKDSFYAMFDRKEPSEKLKDQLITGFFIEPFNQKFQIAIKLKDTTKEEKKKLWGIIQDFLDTLDTLSKEDLWNYKDTDIYTAKSKDVFKSEQQKMKESVLAKFKAIQQGLQENDNGEQALSKNFNIIIASNLLSNVFTRVLKQKKQTVDNNTFSKWMKGHVTFQSLLSQAMNITAQDWNGTTNDFFFPYNDTSKPQQNRILAMNIPLYGNYHRSDESSVSIFLNDSSIENGEGKVYSLLSQFFSEAGLDPSYVEKLRVIAHNEIKNSGSKQGCILQFFDLSLQMARIPYEGADGSAYVSHSWGIPYKKIQPSAIATGAHSLRNNTMDFQLRLIASNYTTLNPHGFLRVVRHDTVGKEISDRIIEKMRDTLKTGHVDRNKLELYKAKLDQAWYNP